MFPYPKPFHKFCMNNLLMTLLGELLRIILLRGMNNLLMTLLGEWLRIILLRGIKCRYDLNVCGSFGPFTWSQVSEKFQLGA